MVRVKEHPRQETIDFHIDEIPLMFHKLYHTLNKPNTCAVCGQRAEYIRVTVRNMTSVKTFKVCRNCLEEES